MGRLCRFVTHPEPDDEIPSPESTGGEPRGLRGRCVGFRPVGRVG
jgi:hypothetical protein